jgi:hypothetical protein
MIQNRMEPQEPQNCWEFMNCLTAVKHRCPAYEHKVGQGCWMIAICYEDKGCPQTKDEGLDYCENKCLWYKKLNPQTA